MKGPSIPTCVFAAVLLASDTTAQTNSSSVQWTNPFLVEPCNGVNVKDITVAELQRVCKNKHDLLRDVVLSLPNHSTSPMAASPPFNLPNATSTASPKPTHTCTMSLKSTPIGKRLRKVSMLNVLTEPYAGRCMVYLYSPRTTSLRLIRWQLLVSLEE